MQNRVSTASPVRNIVVDQSGAAHNLGIFVLCVFLFLLLGRLCDFYLSSLHLPMITSVIALLCALASGRFLDALQSRVSLLMIGLTFWMAIGTPFSIWRGGSVEVLTEWLKTYISFLVITALVTKVSEGIQILTTIALSMSFVAILALFHLTSDGSRAALSQGLYSGANEFATAAVVGIIAWWFLVTQPAISPMLRALYAAIMLFVATLLPRTGSRGGMITFGVVCLVALFHFKPAMRFVTVMVLLVLTAVALFTMPSDVRIRYLGMVSKNVTATSVEEATQLMNASASSQSRWRLLVDSLIITARNPIFGVGLGNFGVKRNEMVLAAGSKRTDHHGTHNTYTQISSEVGIPGLVLFIASIAFCWRDNRRVERLFAGATDIEGMRIRNVAFTLRLLLLSYIVFFCFEHIGYDPFYIVVCALMTAFSQAAFKVHARRKAKGAKDSTVSQGKRRSLPQGRNPLPSLPVSRLLRPGHSGGV